MRCILNENESKRNTRIERHFIDLRLKRTCPKRPFVDKDRGQRIGLCATAFVIKTEDRQSSLSNHMYKTPKHNIQVRVRRYLEKGAVIECAIHRNSVVRW
jgi:hypothetical protein